VSRRPYTVLWYSAISPYMADRFAELHRRGNLEFECWFNRDRNPGRSWVVPRERLEFPHVFVPSITTRGGSIGLPVARYFRRQPDVIVTFHADSGVALSATLAAVPMSRLVYYVEKTFDSWVNRSPIKEAAKRALFSRASGFLTPGTDADEYLSRYGVGADRTFRLSHAIQVDHFARAHQLRRSPDMSARRRAMGLDGFVFLNVGRLWWQKGIDALLAAFRIARDRGVNATLLLVGDGVDRERYMSEVETLGVSDVVFVDFVQQGALPDMFALADAFVFPTRGDPYGLVVDEALASGMPVVATTSAGEIKSRVLEGETGHLVPPDDPDRLAAAMERLARGPSQAARMGATGAKLMADHTPSRWAEQFEAAMNAIRR
jgi:glycosyltransferase involved in cell wall biosynthesis